MMIFMNSWWSGLKCYDAKGRMSYNVSGTYEVRLCRIWAERSVAVCPLLSEVLSNKIIFVSPIS